MHGRNIAAANCGMVPRRRPPSASEAARHLEEWSFSAGADTDLYVFSHGSWIAQTVQTVLGLGAIHPDFADVVSMANAHWVRFVAADMPDGTLRWRLVDYNHGPALADTDQWEHPAL